MIGYAHNGVEALEMAAEMSPDVVLTDIKMPYMDGLELSRKLKEQMNTVKIIIFSGFDEFEYAKEAIDLEVEQYLLKPIDLNELRKVFLRIRENLNREIMEKRNVDKLREYYLESLPMLQENFYTSLIEGRIPENQIDKYRESYQIRLDGPRFLITVLHISSTDRQQELDPFLLTMAVKKLAEEQLIQKHDSRLFSYLGDLVLISQLQSEKEVPDYTDVLDAFCKTARHMCGASVTAGIGPVCDELQDLKASYQGARTAVSYRALYGNTRAINIVEIDPQEDQDELWEEQEISEIMKKIKVGDRDSLNQEIASSIRRFSDGGVSLQKFRIFIMGLVTEMYRFGNNNRLEMDEIFGKEKDVYNKALQADSPELLQEWLLLSCLRMQEKVSKERQDTSSLMVRKAKEYVRENYANQDITIEMVCRELGVSSAYFSTVFKKETGKTFINYLTDYRMERAVDLLLTSGDKTYIIAEKVGYAEPNYFSYVFKKKYGVSPTKYRSGLSAQ